MNKKIILGLVVSVLLTTSVYAGSWIDELKWGKQDPVPCYGEMISDWYLQILNDDETFNKMMKSFPDGYHVLELKGKPLFGSSHYTVFKEDHKLVSVQKGLCVEDNRYERYWTDLDLEYEGRRIRDSFETGDLDLESEAAYIIKNIEGISLYQKFYVFLVAKEQFEVDT